jgi:hypothetical protein
MYCIGILGLITRSLTIVLISNPFLVLIDEIKFGVTKQIAIAVYIISFFIIICIWLSLGILWNHRNNIAAMLSYYAVIIMYGYWFVSWVFFGRLLFL